MPLWIPTLVAAVLVLAIVVVVLLTRRGRRRTRAESAPTPAGRPTAADAAPMTDLESALNRVTDRSGRPIAERLDAESAHVDELRVPDDTGPLLRRALDSVERHEEPDAPGTDESAAGSGDDTA